MPHKTPRSALTPNPLKKPKSAQFVSVSNDERPSWRFSMLEFVDPFGWHQISNQKLREVHSKLKSFESMCWHNILGPNNHSVSIETLCREAQKRLRELSLDDYESLVSLRLTGKERIWGIRQEGGILLLLWWDPTHQVCPCLKKHT